MLSRRTLLIFILAFLANSDHFIDFIKGYKNHKFITSLIELEDYDNCEKTESINSLLLSDNISNKEYIIDRINNASYKVYREDIPKKKDYTGFFSYDEEGNSDFIILDTMYLAEFTIYHEIGHLIDRHKELNVDVNTSDIKKDSIYAKLFSDFYSDFPDIVTENDTITFAEIVFIVYEGEEEYYSSDEEIYARLFSYYSFCETYGVDNVEELKKVLLKLYTKDNGSFIITSLEVLDFLFILPIIDFDEEEKIKLLF